MDLRVWWEKVINRWRAAMPVCRDCCCPALRSARKIVVLVTGVLVLLAGILLIVLPGPAFLVLPAGLAILALEYAWAKRWLRALRAVLPRNRRELTSRRHYTAASLARRARFLWGQLRRRSRTKRVSFEH